MKILQQSWRYVLPLLLFCASCSSQKKLFKQSVNGLNYLGQYTLPHKMQVGGTTLGGLSGIEYNPALNEYYLICDDRSDLSPLRFYTAKISFSQMGIAGVQPIGVTFFTRGNEPYHNRKQDSLNVPDPEALRYHPKNGTLFWSSEGERTVKGGRAILTHPAVTISDVAGRFLDSIPLAPNMYMKAVESGPRNNGVFEGLAFSPDYKHLFVSVEEPLYQDGARAGLFDSTAWVRFIKYSSENARWKQEAQYAYEIDAVVQEPISTGLFVVNGVTDVLAVNEHQLLVTERSFSTGRLGNNIRVYVADLSGAEDIAGVPSLAERKAVRPLRKRLLLNMDKLGILVDNVEGATFGPRLPNGKRSLIFVTDDNFSATQKTQFLLFEVN